MYICIYLACRAILLLRGDHREGGVGVVAVGAVGAVDLIHIYIYIYIEREREITYITLYIYIDNNNHDNNNNNDNSSKSSSKQTDLVPLTSHALLFVEVASLLRGVFVVI